jgi:hypothetical protein
MPAGRGADEWEGCPREAAASGKDAGGRALAIGGVVAGRAACGKARPLGRAVGGKLPRRPPRRPPVGGCFRPSARGFAPPCSHKPDAAVVRRTQTAMTFPCAPDASLAASLALFRCHTRLREAAAGLWLPRIASSPQESAVHLHGSTRSDSPAAAWILLGCKQQTHSRVLIEGHKSDRIRGSLVCSPSFQMFSVSFN